VPLQAASPDATANSAASTQIREIEQIPFIAWIEPLEGPIVQPILQQLKLQASKDL
jgi:hypothetical protein